jgi:uncharacterized protein YjiS (DUF1127 family)
VVRASAGGGEPRSTFAAGLLVRMAWRLRWMVIGALARRHAAERPARLPAWHRRFYNLPRELRLIDEWRGRRRHRAELARLDRDTG